MRRLKETSLAYSAGIARRWPPMNGKGGEGTSAKAPSPNPACTSNPTAHNMEVPTRPR